MVFCAGLVSAYDEAGSGVVYLYEPLESPAVENSRTPAGEAPSFICNHISKLITYSVCSQGCFVVSLAVIQRMQQRRGC